MLKVAPFNSRSSDSLKGDFPIGANVSSRYSRWHSVATNLVCRPLVVPQVKQFGQGGHFATAACVTKCPEVTVSLSPPHHVHIFSCDRPIFGSDVRYYMSTWCVQFQHTPLHEYHVCSGSAYIHKTLCYSHSHRYSQMHLQSPRKTCMRVCYLWLT